MPARQVLSFNVAVETDAADDLKPSKKMTSECIDGIVAAIMAPAPVPLLCEQCIHRGA
ncbi:MAG: hypothetical protein HY763_15895 [Planctomycetes bacterium]|nr:hypothetical protein [Planctomycetota bacterium]